MLASKSPNLEDSVVQAITTGHTTVKDIHTHLSEEGKKYSLQAVYKAINALITAGVIVKHKTNVELSREWATKASQLLETTAQIPDLADGERISYTFTSITHHNAYWKHKVGSLEHIHQDFPLFCFEPHEIWLHLDNLEESQEWFWQSFQDDDRHGFIVIGSKSQQDKKFKKTFTNDYLRINTDSSPQVNFGRTDYITIVEDYVVTTKIDAETSAEIDVIYKKDLNKHAHQKQLTTALENLTEISLQIEKHQKKATRLRRQLSRDFLIAKDIQDEFDLF